MKPNPIIERLADLRNFLVHQIDGSPETRSRDQSVTAHISAVDAASTFIELDDLSKTIGLMRRCSYPTTKPRY
tara:strand:- start:297 stop:515 length:219 start_codon:yes stop_codon:yes gene_type:complete